MAKSKLIIVSLLLVAASLGGTLLLRSTGSTDGDGGWGNIATLPFTPLDVLPLLPRQVAMAALRALRGASDIFPVFVGDASAVPPGAERSPLPGWKGACFYENVAWLVFHNNSGSKYGGGTLHIKVRPVSFPNSQFFFSQLHTELRSSAGEKRKITMRCAEMIDCLLLILSKLITN